MLFRAVLIIFFLQVNAICGAQIQAIDSLENIARTIPDDTVKVRQLNILVSALRERDNKKAMVYAIQARDLAVKLGDEPGIATSLEHIGWIHYRKGEYSEALELSIESLSINEKLNDRAAIARCLNGIAAINIEQNQHGLAIANFKRAYAIGKEIGDATAMARSLCNVGFCYLGLMKIDSARVYATRGLEISEKNNKPYITGFALRTLGDVDLYELHYKAALDKFNRVIKISDSLQNIFLKVSTLHRMGKAYFALGDNENAIFNLTQNVAMARKFQFRSELERSLKLLSEIYASMHETNKAFAFQNQYLIVHDSLYQQRSSEQMALMQARFDSEMKETEIKLLTKDAQLKQAQINRQRLWMYISAGCFSLMVILAIVLLYNIRLKKRANNELEIKNRETKQQAQVLQNVNITKDKLFSIISHDLRSPLASLRGLMHIMDMDGLTSEEFVMSSRKLKKNLESVQQDLDNLLAWAQSQLNGLQSHPTNLKIHRIIEEKIHLFNEVAHQKEITIVNEVDPSLSVIADKDHIGLVIRNLLANAIKFNKRGGLIRISERTVGIYTEISVSDSGVGMTENDLGRLFNVETHFTNPGTHQEKGVGIGLLLTKEFVEKNGGSIRATSEHGKGSTFTFTLKQETVLATTPA